MQYTKLFRKNDGDAIIFCGQQATSEYWDKYWSESDMLSQIRCSRNSIYWKSLLETYFTDKNSVILEGGCGTAHLVDAMNFWGYKAVGIDYAKQTVNNVKALAPELNISVGDVRGLAFSDNYFDGYFSLGVIEHFWVGYQDILKEAYRVLKPGGFFFVSFPCISYIDRLFLRHMDLYFSEKAPENFYQFALNPRKVILDLEQNGFAFIRSNPKSGLLGLARYSSTAASLHKRISKMKGSGGFQNKFSKIVSVVIESLLAPFSVHSVLIIFKKV